MARSDEQAGVKSIKEIDSGKGLSSGEDEEKLVPGSSIKRISPLDGERR